MISGVERTSCGISIKLMERQEKCVWSWGREQEGMSKKGSRSERQIELLADAARQAVGSFRGYAHHVRQTVRAWLCCANNEEIYCEFAEDVDIVRRDADG